MRLAKGLIDKKSRVSLLLLKNGTLSVWRILNE